MRTSTALSLAALALLAACAGPERSRNLADPNVPALTLAQQVCSNCHGLNGVAVSPNFPNLASQVPDYFVAQMKGFKGHSRQDPAGFEYMWGLSRHLSEEQIKGLAAYYAKQPAARQAPEGEPAAIESGRQVFTSGIPDKGVPACFACHGQDGQGHDAFPRLAGQHADYLVKQLNVFQRTDERPEGSVMKTVAHGLTPENIGNVAAYLQAAAGR